MIALLALALASQAPLSADAAVAAALKNSNALESHRVSVAQEEADRSLRLRPLELRLGHRSLDSYVVPNTDNGVPYGPLDDGFVSLGWRLPEPWRVTRALTAADDVAAANDELKDAELALAVQVRQVHGQLVRKREELKLRAEAVRLAVLLEKTVGAQAEAQATTVLDVRLAGLDRLDAELELADAEVEERALEERLAGLTGLSPPLALVADAPRCAAPPALEATVAAAMARSSKVRALRARLEAARSRAGLSWIRFLPWVDGVQLGYFNEPVAKRDQLRGSVDVALPVFELVSQERRQEELAARQLEIALREEERSLRGKLAGVLHALDAAWQAKQTLDASAVALAQASIADAEAALAAGQADALRVAEVQRRALRARHAQLRAAQRCEEAALELLPRTAGAGTGAPALQGAISDDSPGDAVDAGLD